MRSRRRHLVLLLAIALLWTAPRATALTPPRVAIVKSNSIGPFDSAIHALTESLHADALQPELLTFDLEGDTAKGPATLSEVRGVKPDLIVTVGSLATALVLAEPITVPVVFSMVLYPQQSGFVSSAGQPVTGAALDVPLDIQFRYLHRVAPAARRVGVLYHPAETGSIVEEARRVATAQGLTLVAAQVDGPADTPAALRNLMEQVDVIWAVADSHVFTPQTTPKLILDALRRRIPFFGLSATHVRLGAIAALTVDYTAIGRQTAALVLRILHGDAAAKIAIWKPDQVNLALNLRAAQLLGMDVALDLQREATDIVR